MNTTEMKMPRWIPGKTRRDDIRNVIIWEKAHIIKPRNTFLKKKRLSSFGHDDNVAKSVLTTQIEGSHSRGRPKLRGVDHLKKQETKYDTPRVGIRQREVVRDDTKCQPYPGNDGKMRNYGLR